MYTPRNFNMPIKKIKVVYSYYITITHPWLTRFTQFKCIYHCSNGPYLKRKKIFDVELLVCAKTDHRLQRKKVFIHETSYMYKCKFKNIYCCEKKWGGHPHLGLPACSYSVNG